MGMHTSALAYERKNDDAGALPVEIKQKLDELQKAWKEQRDSYEAQSKEIKKGFDDVIRKEELDRRDAKIDETIESITKEIAALKRPQLGGSDENSEEVKSFNVALISHAMAASRPAKNATAQEFAEYKAAFSAWMREGKDNLSPEQVKALSVGSDPDGGYMVTPDTSGRIVKKVFETSPMRQICSVVSISTDRIEGKEDLDEASAGWVGETAARPATATPQLGIWEIPVHEVYAKPEVTQKFLDDAAMNAEQWLADKIGQKMARMENTAFVTGDGIRKPKGLTAYTTAADSGTGVTWGSIGHIVTGANGAFAASNPIDNIYELIGLLKAEYLMNSRFLTRRKVITLMKKFKDSTGQYLWSPPTANTPESFAGYPIARAEDLPDLGAGSLSLYFGDFREAYTIVDRAGIRTLRDPYSNKPYVQFYATKRVGGGMVNYEAIKALKFGT